MNSATLIILVLVVLLLAGAVIVLLLQNKSANRWKCREGSCEQDINGDYASKSSCQEACKAKAAMMQAQQDQANAAWACNSNYQCIPASQGFTSEELCKQNCQVPSTVYYPEYSYYPQSLWYRPWYWGSSWGGWGGRGRGGRGGRGSRGR